MGCPVPTVEVGWGGDQWQRVVMNHGGVEAEHLLSLGPEKRSAVEISGDAQEGQAVEAFYRLNYPSSISPIPRCRGERSTS